MHPKSDGCRLCLDSFAECFITIDNPQLKVQMDKVFRFPIEPTERYCSGVCQSCSYAISEFYQYSEKVRLNQEVLNGNVPYCDPTVDSKVTLESFKVETLSDSGLAETTEDACEPQDEVSEEEQEEVSNSGDESHEPPPRKPQTKREEPPRKRKLDDLDAEEPTKNFRKTNWKTQQERDEEDQLFNKYFRMICDLCGTPTATYAELRNHFWKEHKRRDGYVVCCNKKLFYRHAIRDHMYFHVNPDVFRCEVCGKTYKNKIILNRHMLYGHSRENHQCPKCDKMFATKNSLSIHMTNQHSGKDRTMVCGTCGKEFLTKQCFDRHMNEHMGIEVQRFQCGICQRWLKGKRNFQNHMKWVHTSGNQEFQCDICLQKFPHIRALQCHKLRVHAEPKHECEFCGKKFQKPISLKEHRTTHTGEVLYVCDYCGISKNSRANLQHHIKQKHAEELAQKKLKAIEGNHHS